jgi:Tol biopolymer transport system component
MVPRREIRALILVAMGLAVLSCDPFPLLRPKSYLYPAVFTPDGNSIVFPVSHGSRCDLYRADIATGVVRRWLWDESRCLMSPTFSPDGQRLAYMESEREGEQANLMLANADGTNEWLVVTDNDNNSSPRFVPDTHIILFLRPGADVFAVDFMTRRVRQLTHQAYNKIYGLSASPDGRQLLLSADDSLIVSSIDSADTSIMRLRPQPFAFVTLCTWLPDGRSVLFAGGARHPGGTGSDVNVYRLTLATGDVVPLTQFTGDFHGLRVSPDGTKAVVLYQDAYHIIDLATHRVTRLRLEVRRSTAS